MSFVYYAVLAIVSLSSVVFGLEWLSEAPPVWKPVAVASVKQPVKPPVKQATNQPAQPATTTKATAGNKTATTAQSGAAGTQAPASGAAVNATAANTQQTAMASPNAGNTAGTPAPSGNIMVPEPSAQTSAAPAPLCDVEACRQAYFTFNPADCTYQPIDGPRRLCTRGTPPQTEAKTEPATSPPADEQATQEAAAPVSNKCDIEACQRAYKTFNPADCTYKPTLYGPRALCTKGTPPAPDTAQAPAQETKPDEQTAAVTADTPPDATVSQQTGTDTAATAPQVSDKCDVEACKQAYFTFNPADCTYQPSDGPRRLCTRGTPPAPDTAQAPQETKPDEQAAAVSAETSPTASPAQEPGQETGTDTAAAPPVSNKCDIDACKKAYFTFNPTDCTYQPTDGPRRLCTKGTPPRPDAAQAPAQDNAPNKPDTVGSVGAAPADSASADTAPQVSNKCDIDACKKAYFTFNPADCTYQPSDGPRRLCTRGTPPGPQAATPRAAPDHPVPPALVPSARR